MPKAVEKARAKAAAENVDVRFEHADVTDLCTAGIGSQFALIVDSGCLHGMNDDDRYDYVREITAAAGLPTHGCTSSRSPPASSYGRARHRAG